MNELIKITTSEQGEGVVSARELHGFLEVKTKFADWIKARIIKYGFLQDTDYMEVEGFSENSEKGGRPTVDYALTLDTAKQLTMVENNERGRQARRYFIQAEKALRQHQPTPISTEHALIQLVSQQTQLMADTQRMIAQLRTDVNEVKASQRSVSRRPLSQEPFLPKSSKPVTSSLSYVVSRKVQEYCTYYGVEQGQAYNYLYKRLYDQHGVNVHRLHRKPGESILDAVERHGHLDRLYSLIRAELTYPEE